jgi:hypothetical protein
MAKNDILSQLLNHEKWVIQNNDEKLKKFYQGSIVILIDVIERKNILLNEALTELKSSENPPKELIEKITKEIDKENRI